MRQKKVTFIISYDHKEADIASNERIAIRIKEVLIIAADKKHEIIGPIAVEDI